jgi:hypothetical protein
MEQKRLEPAVLKVLIDYFQKLICTGFGLARGFVGLPSILSYRDVKRILIHFQNFFLKLLKDGHRPIDPIWKAVIFSMTLCFIYRFSTCIRIPWKKSEDGNGVFDVPGVSHDTVVTRCREFQLKFTPHETFATVDLRSAIAQQLQNIPSPYSFPKSLDWCKETLEYARTRSDKYLTHAGSLLRLPSVCIHLLALSSCFRISRRPEFQTESLMTCLLIGMPGTSKTRTIELFIQWKLSRTAKRDAAPLFLSTFLSTRSADTDGLNAHFLDCAEYLWEENKRGTANAICVIDELGLANLNPSQLLKLLHYYFDKGVPTSQDPGAGQFVRVLPFAASNYTPDYANMNRGLLICTDTPTDDELRDAASKGTGP